MDVIGWLMEGDPSIRWQVQRDLLDRAESTWKRERAQLARRGWGADLLARQDVDGGWSGAVYSPKWTSTHYTLLQLVRLGLAPSHPAGRPAVDKLLTAGRYENGSLNLAKTVPVADGCVNGMVLLMASYFGTPGPIPDGIASWLLTRQMADGGWNCEDWRGATHGSFHTTISVLEGLEAYRLARPAEAEKAADAVAAGREFLLVHRLYKSHRTGDVADPVFTRFSFPPRWHYDVLRGLDYLAAVDAGQDPRIEDAIDLVNSKRRDDGTWVLQHPHTGRLHFRMEQGGKPSRWNTLRALRVLKWWSQAG
ncbi:MAG: hypothetical protein HKO82_01275 [Acidimicrobiia bacterium]|nr:hypothetical protein [Acidimicrobiia bacterium]NNJ48246.1 hypothetical protein [Acidimicrobiia bacterium]NNL12302.1 hypothetical protein [Acidimicrobiia bacterium]